MLSKTPRRFAGPPSRVNQVDETFPNDLWKSLERKLARDVSTQFLRLARIPDSNAEEYRNAMSRVLREWMLDAVWVTQASKSHLHDLLPDVKHKAVALRRQLEDFRRLVWETAQRMARSYLKPYTTDPRAHGYDDYGRFDVSVADPAIEALAALIGELDRFTSRRGRSHGTKAYPGLSQLVSELEFVAQCHNGKFTFNKRHGKGTLIQALNWLRAFCLSEPEWTWMAPNSAAPQPASAGGL